jgi:large subunit ribosomal protein L22
VGKNFSMRRFHARGRGRMSPVEKPFSQLTVVVKEVAAEEAQDEKKSAARKKGKATPEAEAKETA